MPNWMSGILFHKLTVKLIYTAGIYATSHSIALLSCVKTQEFLSNIGVAVSVTDPMRLRAYMTGLLLMGGEVGYHFLNKHILEPHVTGVEG